jgi:hypothetical protein
MIKTAKIKQKEIQPQGRIEPQTFGLMVRRRRSFWSKNILSLSSSSAFLSLRLKY